MPNKDMGMCHCNIVNVSLMMGLEMQFSWFVKYYIIFFYFLFFFKYILDSTRDGLMVLPYRLITQVIKWFY